MLQCDTSEEAVLYQWLAKGGAARVPFAAGEPFAQVQHQPLHEEHKLRTVVASRWRITLALRSPWQQRWYLWLHHVAKFSVRKKAKHLV